MPVDAQTNGDARGDAEAAVAVAASTAPATVTGDEPAGDAQAAEDAPGAEHGRRQTVIDDLTIDTSVGAESGAPSSGTRRAGRWALWLVTLASLGAAGGAGWQWMQQMAYTVALQENLDAANQEAMLSQEDSIAAREQTETVRAQMAILNAPNMETLHLEGQPAAPDASARWITSDTAGTPFFCRRPAAAATRTKLSALVRGKRCADQRRDADRRRCRPYRRLGRAADTGWHGWDPARADGGDAGTRGRGRSADR